jgi:hypothetical protein
MAVILALLVIGGDFYPWILAFQKLRFLSQPEFYLSFIAYGLAFYMLVWLPVSKRKEGGLPSTHLE